MTQPDRRRAPPHRPRLFAAVDRQLEFLVVSAAALPSRDRLERWRARDRRSRAPDDGARPAPSSRAAPDPLSIGRGASEPSGSPPRPGPYFEAPTHHGVLSVAVARRLREDPAESGKDPLELRFCRFRSGSPPKENDARRTTARPSRTAPFRPFAGCPPVDPGTESRHLGRRAFFLPANPPRGDRPPGGAWSCSPESSSETPGASLPRREPSSAPAR